MFVDLVGSTTLSQQLDPEDYHARVRAYQTACHQVITRYEGHIAQYLGDGVLVYFGYPVAHEEDAGRAVRSGLEIVAAVSQLQFTPPLQVRIGLHTGPVVVAEIGTGARTEQLALGETPNIAARVQGLAEPDTVVISAATSRLVQGLFECQDLGPQALKGLSTPLTLYRVEKESTAQSRFEVAVRTGLTPLVGREHEVELLQERWQRAKQGEGQVVLLSGEPGIGKSRLVQELKEQLAYEGVMRIEFRCSPYYRNSALYPIIDHPQRLLQFAREDSPAAKLEKLQHTLSHSHFPQADTLPLLAALLSLPHPEGYPPITVSPQKQKEKTQVALVAWLLEEAEQKAVYNTWEDLHWADPSTLEVLNLIVDQAPTARLYVLLTFRPEFLPPWGNRSHLSQMTLSRLGQQQMREMVRHVAEQAVRASTGLARTAHISPSDSDPVRPELVEGRVTLSDDLIDAVVARTDGVPLFVEELTKSVVESVGSVESIESVGSGGRLGRSAVSLGIPATLQDALMARLDRLGPAKEIAQLGATIGREFSYEILAAVSPLDEERLLHGLKQLVEAELVYQRGLLPQAHYLFKHALIQDTAYQSLLKTTRQQYHQQIAQILETQFRETVETQPELLAHHYTEASLIEQALPYWQRAGERATQRSANAEAINHLNKGLELLKTLPDTPERAQQELMLQITLGAPLTTTKGHAAPEVGKAYARARELCRQFGETPRLFRVLHGLCGFYYVQGKFQAARELGEQCLGLAQREHDPVRLLAVHEELGLTLFCLGELISAREHLEQGIRLYDPQQRRFRAFRSGQAPGVACLSFAAAALWHLGYPEQALKRSHEALTLAQKLSHPYSMAFALGRSAVLHQLRREGQAAQERAEATITLSTEQGFTLWLAAGNICRGWALAEQGEEGIAQIRQGLAAYRATGGEATLSHLLALLAEAHGKMGQAEEGLNVLAEALVVTHKNQERFYEAELYRLKGELLLTQESKNQKSKGKSQKSENTDPRPLAPDPQEDAEACFLKAIEIARQQQAKSLELRASTSLARLWQQQGKRREARNTLSEIYNWFTEGFETKDLQEAKALIGELS
jgi:predicted ATPase/class 3 adenylate cyclase